MKSTSPEEGAISAASLLYMTTWAPKIMNFAPFRSDYLPQARSLAKLPPATPSRLIEQWAKVTHKHLKSDKPRTVVEIRRSETLSGV
jgi:hypothetical protein